MSRVARSWPALTTFIDPGVYSEIAFHEESSAVLGE